MTLFRGVNNAMAQQGPAFSPITGGDGGGKRAGFYDEYTIPATGFADGDDIELGPAPALRKGDRFLAVTLYHAILGAGTSIRLGDDADAARYIASAASTTAGFKTIAPAGFGYVLTIDRPLRARITGGAATPAAKIQLEWTVLRA